jgi:Type II secretion system (T2SS), protein K
VAAERQFLSAGSRVKLIAGNAMGAGNRLVSGRGGLFADGRPMQLEDQGERVFVQDLNGLVSLRRPELPVFSGLLAGCGAPQAQQPALVDALADYLDADGFKRLNGAEAFEYRAAALPPPRNAWMLSVEELWRVLGWASIRQAWAAADCDALVSVRGLGRFNQQTAPERVLLASGLDPQVARAVVEARNAGLPRGDGPRDALGDALSPMLREGGGSIAPVVRVRHELASLEWALQYELELTPTVVGGPWQVHEMRVVPPRRSESMVLAKFPPLDFVASEQERAFLNALSASPFGR